MKLYECKGCRKRKELVAHVRGLGYCEDCKEKVPSKRDLDEYLYEREKMLFNELAHKSQRGLGSGKSYDKE